jgi:hypothetical protein
MSDENKIPVLEGEGNKPETPNPEPKAKSQKPKANSPKPKANSQQPKANSPKPEVKPKVKPVKPQPIITTDEQKASEIKRKKGVSVVYKVGRYWFTEKQYAEQSERTQKITMQIFD